MAQRNSVSLNPWMAAVGLVLLLVTVYFVIKGLFWLLGIIGPILLIIAFVMDPKVVTGYGKWIVDLTRKNWMYGIGAGLMTFFGFPFVCAFLFGKVMLKRKFKGLTEDLEKRTKGEFVEYEEVDSTTSNVEDVEFEDIETLELEEFPEPPKKIQQKETRGNNDYDQMFE